MRGDDVKWFHRDGMGQDPVAMHGAPVSFSADIGQGSLPTLATAGSGIAAGATGVFDTSALQNGYRTPYYIDEIRMRCWAPVDGPGGFNEDESIALGSFAMAFQFRAGGLAFSKEPIPMGLYAPNYNGKTLFTTAETAASAIMGASVRWLLPRPLFMQPGDVITAHAVRNAAAMLLVNDTPVSPALVNVGITYVGRALPPGAKAPISRHVPWVGQYQYTISDNYAQANVNGYNPFRNPFTEALTIHRLTGKVACASATGAGNFIERPAADFHAMLPTKTGYKYVTCYIEDSAGYKVTRKFSAVGSIFDTERNAWTFNRALGPREALNVQFRTVGANAPDGSVIDTFAMGMIGHREEAA